MYRTSLYLAASASAEFFADIALCPMESVKVRVQTAPLSDGWGTTLRECAPRLWQREGIYGYVGITIKNSAACTGLVVRCPVVWVRSVLGFNGGY